MAKRPNLNRVKSLTPEDDSRLRAGSDKGTTSPSPTVESPGLPPRCVRCDLNSDEPLAHSEARYRRLFEAAKDGILILDAQTGVITDANPFLAELLEYSVSEMVGKQIWDLKAPKDVDASKRGFRELQANRYARYDDLPLVTRSGVPISVEVVSNVYQSNGKKVIQCNIRDIRPRKEAERSDQLNRQTQKMEAIGQLAGGLAHDFNNLLGVILGYCEILEDQTEMTEANQRIIHEIQSAGTSAKNLTQRLLAFSRRQMLQPVTMDLNDTVSQMEKMLARLIGENIELVSDLSKGLGRINADPSQIEQVLMNLTINARDAMPKGGKIVIETANIDVDETYRRQHPSTGVGSYVMLSVCDTGSGMDQQTQARIFEPFFTTKPPGQGTGLGLSTVFGIVKQSGGTITVYSEPGAGATFKIFFPRSDQPAAASPDTKGARKHKGTETILVVDDADALRKLMRLLLEESGYNVLDSGDPADALRIAGEHVGPIPLMITDVIMPGFSGTVLAERVAKIRPETKVLYASGFSDNSLIPLQVLGQEHAFLEKPFTRADLLRKVRILLDSSMRL